MKKSKVPSFIQLGHRVGIAIFLSATLLISGCASSSNPPPTLPTFRSGSSLTVYLPANNLAGVRNIYHEVGPYETLWRISGTYGVDIETIMRANNLTDPTKLKKGQKLLIPATRGPRPNIPLFMTNRWTHIVVHHTATDQGSAYSIDKLHLKRGWENGMGYQFLIDNGTRGKSLGQIEVGPRWLKQMDGAHTKQGNWNKNAIGIAVVGNFSEGRLPEPMMQNLVFLVRLSKRLWLLH